MPSEDVKDESRAVDDLDLAAKDLLEVRLLRGGKLVVKDDDVHVHAADRLGNLNRLAGTYEGLG